MAACLVDMSPTQETFVSSTMPELPEVENFRKLLQRLVSESPLSMKAIGEKPPKIFLSKDDVESINEKCYLLEVLRKGKLICMVLSFRAKKQESRKC